MKTLIKSVIAAVVLASAIATSQAANYGSFKTTSQRDYVSIPTLRNQAFTSMVTSEAPATTSLRYVRTPANDTVTDNLSYRGFGTIRVPRSYTSDSLSAPSTTFKTMPYYGGSAFGSKLMPATGSFTPKSRSGW
jgi:hypothetical protein